MAAVPRGGLVEQDGGLEGPPYTRYGPVEFGNGCDALTGINLARRFGSGKGCKGVGVGAGRCGHLNCREGFTGRRSANTCVNHDVL